MDIKTIIEVMEGKGYVVFKNDTKPFNINYVGIRDERNINTFNDWLIIFWKYLGKWNFFSRPGTTDPGTYWLDNPGNVDGTALLKENQYRSTWKIGKHRGSYEALVQKKEVTVYRDKNRDGVLDLTGKEYTGYFGINHHKSGKSSTQVNKWSAGCQVTADEVHYNIAMQIFKEATKVWGEGITYTLLNKKDF